MSETRITMTEDELNGGGLTPADVRRLQRNFARNRPGLYRRYRTLPRYEPGTVVRCPTRNTDGTPIGDDDVPGCGSDNVVWSGDVYDCRECGIFFNDYAADPPHRRQFPEDLPPPE